MRQGQAISYVVAICLMEFAPSVVVGPHLPISLRQYLQFFRYVRDDDQLLELHSEVMLRGRIPLCACPPLGPLVGLFRPFLLHYRFVDSHRLRSGDCSWSDRGDETLLLHYSIICGNVC